MTILQLSTLERKTRTANRHSLILSILHQNTFLKKYCVSHVSICFLPSTVGRKIHTCILHNLYEKYVMFFLCLYLKINSAILSYGRHLMIINNIFEKLTKLEVIAVRITCIFFSFLFSYIFFPFFHHWVFSKMYSRIFLFYSWLIPYVIGFFLTCSLTYVL